ncbi:g1.5 [Ichnoviriform fugitivi]|uniref:G1.5 n=1 Tax=Ichnoviriform fugitivi TaxID=265522 RepID=A2Q0Q1_9VIRU|nr:g1.5 [Ichnoviriform fugitivi]BAF45766.1 g1.5 [Ichnoviriform fugitivi]
MEQLMFLTLVSYSTLVNFKCGNDGSEYESVENVAATMHSSEGKVGRRQTLSSRIYGSVQTASHGRLAVVPCVMQVLDHAVGSKKLYSHSASADQTQSRVNLLYCIRCTAVPGSHCPALVQHIPLSEWR